MPKHDDLFARQESPRCAACNLPTEGGDVEHTPSACRDWSAWRRRHRLRTAALLAGGTWEEEPFHVEPQPASELAAVLRGMNGGTPVESASPAADTRLHPRPLEVTDIPTRSPATP